MSGFSCFVVGNGAISSKCLEILRHENMRVLGVYSTDGSLKPWTGEQHIHHSSSQLDFQEQLRTTDYDYLFSINNTAWIIPPDILSKARQTTINYHDSWLPKYAGLHATSWALIQGERQHGVTWHKMTAEIDAGNILKQTVVPILPDDTAFSLNTRCFDTAIASFSELVQALKTGRVQPQPQDLSQRTYFGPSDRPNCLLRFDQSAAQLCNLVRGLDFGPIQNPLGMAKLWLPEGVVNVSTAAVIAPGQGMPGEILALGADSLDIATVNGVVRLGNIATLEGQPVTGQTLKTDYGCHVGQVLPVLQANLQATIRQQTVAFGRHEPWWVNRLSQLNPFRHPYLSTKQSARPQRYPLSMPPDCGCPQGGAQAWLAMFAVYCARLTTEFEFDLGLQTHEQRSLQSDVFAQQVPLRIQVQPSESFSQFQTRFEARLASTSGRGSYGLDIYARYPTLGESQPDLEVTLVLAASPSQLDWQDLGMALVAYEDGSQPEIVHGGSLSHGHARAMVSQLQTLMAACIERPDTRISQLPLLSEGKRHQILEQWNQTTRSVPQDCCIHQLFEARVSRYPEQVAVVFGAQQLTYGELNQRANQLAHHLQAQGIGPDSLVGLHMDRSLDMMVGLLGIHKAGGAYVPLDPEFPQDRLRYMLQDCQASVILTQSHLSASLTLDYGAQVIALDRMDAVLAEQAVTNPESGVSPENLSYTIYTSGSTGRPKGVMVEHRNVVNFFMGMDDTLGQDSTRESPGVWLAVTSLSFDISVLELFWTVGEFVCHHR